MASTTPPLLLTKRLHAFLHANQTTQLPTLLLTTHHGKLLAHASPHAVSVLRTHATVAASLLAIHTSSSVDVPSALPGSRTPPDSSSPSSPSSDTEALPQRVLQPVTITVQLSGGTVIIRRLKCGLLFVAVGPSAHDVEGPENGDGTATPSEVESLDGRTTSSLNSVGAASVVVMRRQAGDLARWLDEKLGTLCVPEDGVGSSG